MPAVRSSSHDATPTMVSHSNATVKKISVFRNGDAHQEGLQVVVNTRQMRDLDVLLESISQRIGLVNGAKKLYNASGVQVRSIESLHDGHTYVASSGHFTPMVYGSQPVKLKKVIKKESRKVEKAVQEMLGSPKKLKRTEKRLESIERSVDKPPPGDKENKVKKKKRKNSKTRKTNVKKEETNRISRSLSPKTHIAKRLPMPDDVESVEIELPSDDDEEENVDEHRSRHRPTSVIDDVARDLDQHRVGSRRPSVDVPKSPDTRRHSIQRPQSRPSSRPPTRPKTPEPRQKRKESEKENSKERRKSQVPNWGDLSSFTKNIESLLRK